jgi:hypothetical protein
MNAKSIAIKLIIILSLAILICMTVTSTTVLYTFKCKSNDANSTMTHDSRLSESILEDNGYASGYQAGSFNYLQKGQIEFEDMIEYHQGHNGSKSDASVFHNMTIFFEGEKGTSKFYAKGFYPNNRVISSRKDIRFEELSSDFFRGSNVNFYNLESNYSSKQIRVNAEVIMGPVRNSDIGYNFTYNATVVNGVIEAWDILGWTNKTGARRIDWEQTALMKGNISIENKLLASDLFDIPCYRNWFPY